MPSTPSTPLSARVRSPPIWGCWPGSCCGSWWHGSCTAPSSCSPNRGVRSRTSAARVGQHGLRRRGRRRADRRRRAGGAVRGLSDAGGSVRGAGQAAQDAVATLAFVLAVVLVVLPVGWLLVRGCRRGCATRGRPVRRGGSGPARRAGDPRRAGVATALPRLAALPAGTGAAWRSGEPTAVRALAALELTRLGLRLPAATGSASSSLPADPRKRRLPGDRRVEVVDGRHVPGGEARRRRRRRPSGSGPGSRRPRPAPC